MLAAGLIQGFEQATDRKGARFSVCLDDKVLLNDKVLLKGKVNFCSNTDVIVQTGKVSNE